MRSDEEADRYERKNDQTAILVVLGVVVALAALLVLALWVAPLLIALVMTGDTGRLTGLQVLHTFWRGGSVLHGGHVVTLLLGEHPALAYPATFRWRLPAGSGYWALFWLIAALPAAAVVVVWHRIAIVRSLPVVDRRWYSLRGGRPGEFARWGTVRSLVVPCAQVGRHIVGRFAGALVATKRGTQIAVIAAPDSGKTSGVVIPMVLEHEGPCVVLTTKTDVLNATLARRRALGEVLVWDPFGVRTGGESDGWDPLEGCEDWEHALLVGQWLDRARSPRQGESGNAKYFSDEAQDLTAPLLHAAASDPQRQRTIADVLEWVLEREQQAPELLLKRVGAADAIKRLRNVYAYNDRQRDGILGTAKTQLRAFGHPAAANAADRDGRITAERLFSGNNTLYIVAGLEQQVMLAPLIVTLLSSLVHVAQQREMRTGQGLGPPCLMACDEIANTAPFGDLPKVLSTSRSAGVQWLTIWQSLSQIVDRYGHDAADEILGVSTVRLFLGAIADPRTRDYLRQALGQHQLIEGEHVPHRQTRDVLTAQAMHQQGDDRGVLLHKGVPPAVIRQRRWYADPALKRLAAGKELRVRAAQLALTAGARRAAGQIAGQIQAVRERPALPERTADVVDVTTNKVTSADSGREEKAA